MDFGCGEGTLALEIQKSGAKVTGVDLSHEMVKSARAKWIDAMVMSATELEFKDPWYFPSIEEYSAVLDKVEYCELIPRPTPVDDIANWLDLFANGVTAHLSREEFDLFKEEVSRVTKPILFDENNGWHVDYVRLRVRAVRENK